MPGESSTAIRILKARRLGEANLDDFADRTVAAVAALAGVDVYIAGPTPDKAGTPFVVSHGLGEVPHYVTMVDNGDFGGICFARAEDKAQWTSAHVVLRCTVNRETNLTVRLTRRAS